MTSPTSLIFLLDQVHCWAPLVNSSIQLLYSSAPEFICFFIVSTLLIFLFCSCIICMVLFSCVMQIMSFFKTIRNSLSGYSQITISLDLVSGDLFCSFY